MSHRELVLKWVKGSICLLLMVVCYVLMFVFIDSDLLACLFLILSFAFLLIFTISILRKGKRNSNIAELIKKSIHKNPLSLKKIQELYKYKGLDNIDEKILKVFFNEDNTKRFIVYQDSNLVRVKFEELNYYEDETKHWTLAFASWEPCNLASHSSIYADEEVAIENNKEILEGFKEEKLNIAKTQKYNVEIVWKGITIESDLIPFGSYNEFDIQIKDKKITAKIHNNHWFSEINSRAILYIEEKDAMPKTSKFKFTIYNKDTIIGKGRICKG